MPHGGEDHGTAVTGPTTSRSLLRRARRCCPDVWNANVNIPVRPNFVCDSESRQEPAIYRLGGRVRAAQHFAAEHRAHPENTARPPRRRPASNCTSAKRSCLSTHGRPDPVEIEQSHLGCAGAASWRSPRSAESCYESRKTSSRLIRLRRQGVEESGRSYRETIRTDETPWSSRHPTCGPPPLASGIPTG
jgi:hypothetical protein